MDENKIPESGQEKKPEAGQETQLQELQQKYAEMQKKQEDLNRGIAKYRDESTQAMRRAKELEEENAKLKTAFSGGNEDEKLAVLANKYGFVKKEDLEKEKLEEKIRLVKEAENEAITEFLEKYPQYNENEEWDKVTQEFGLYKTPTTKQGFKVLLEKIHKEFSKSELKEQAKAEAMVEMKNKSRLSLGGGSQGYASGEAELDSLKKRYPNLSKEQLQGIISEIDSLYPEEGKK